MLQETTIFTQGIQRGIGSPLQQLSQYIVYPYKIININAYLLQRNIWSSTTFQKERGSINTKGAESKRLHIFILQFSRLILQGINYFQQLFPKHQVICDLIFCRLINKTAVCTSCILFEMWTSTEEYVFWRTITVSRSKLNIQILNLASIDMLVN